MPKLKKLPVPKRNQPVTVSVSMPKTPGMKAHKIILTLNYDLGMNPNFVDEVRADLEAMVLDRLRVMLFDRIKVMLVAGEGARIVKLSKRYHAK